jgi:hypothetical protein
MSTLQIKHLQIKVKPSNLNETFPIYASCSGFIAYINTPFVQQTVLPKEFASVKQLYQSI